MARRGRNIALAAILCAVGVGLCLWREAAIEWQRFRLSRDLSLLETMFFQPEGSIPRRAVERFARSEEGRTAVLDAILGGILKGAPAPGTDRMGSLRESLKAEIEVSGEWVHVRWGYPAIPSRRRTLVTLDYAGTAFHMARDDRFSGLWEVLRLSGQEEITSRTFPELRFTAVKGEQDREGAPARTLRARRQVQRPLAEIRRDLQSPEVKVRGLALHDLASLSDGTAAIPDLVQVLREGSWPVEEALCRVGAPAVPALLDLFREGAGGEGAARTGPPAAPLLLDLFRNKDPEAFWKAAHLFADCEAMRAPAAAQLHDLLQDGDARVRGRAAKALGRLEAAASGSVPRLREALADPDPAVRRHAENAIERIERNPPSLSRP